MLKKSILQDAVQGKLVPQNPNDEPACKLLQRIAAEKQRLIKAGEIKKDKRDSTIVRRGASFYEIANTTERCIDDELPFDLPKGWEWARLNSIAFVNGGYAFKSTDFTQIGIRVIRISDFNESGFIDTNIVRHPYIASLEQFELQNKNILLCMTGGTVGKSYFTRSIHEKMYVNQRVAIIKICGIMEEYVNFVTLSPLIQDIITKSKNSTNDNISMETIKGFLIPIPPLAEQRRIVDRIESLFSTLSIR